MSRDADEAGEEGEFEDFTRRSRGRLLRPEDILRPKQYLNYQHGRLLSGLMVFLGCMFLLVGVVKFLTPVEAGDPKDEPPAFYVACAVLGAAGVIGGAAAYNGNRQLAWVGFFFALPLLCGIPIGTVVGLFWMLGLSRHLAACDRVRRARAGDDE